MSPMTRTTFQVATLMILLGAGFYLGTGMHSKTALIPAIFGFVLAIAGFIATKGEHARKHAMHVGAMVGLLGTLTIGMAIPRIIGGKLVAGIEMLIFSLISLVYLILCVKSFIDARKTRAYLEAKRAAKAENASA